MQQNKILTAIYLIGLFAVNTLHAKVISYHHDSLIIIEKFQDLEKLWENQPNDKVQLFNFWATWCKPCVRELGIFELFNQKNRDRLSVTLVSLDRLTDINRLKEFLSRRETTTDVMLLADKNSSDWIDKVHPDWSGAIPATLVVCGNKKYLLEQEFESYNELNEAVRRAIDQSKL